MTNSQSTPNDRQIRSSDHIGDINKMVITTSPSLKEQALTALYAIAAGANDMREQNQDLDTIRRALEQLDD